MNPENTNPTNPAENTNPTNPKKPLARGKKPAATYQSFTRGDRAYSVSSAVLNDIKTVYPFLFDFLNKTNYTAARELKIFISHNLLDTATNKKTRVNTFITIPGTNKIKTFPKPGKLTFSIDAAIKTFPALKPINQLIDPTVYITISAKSDFRYYISFKN